MAGGGPAPLARVEPLGRTLGEFIIKKKIGEGGFGAVYLAEQPLLGREVVVKVLHVSARETPELRQRFLREAKLASAIDHPFAAHVYSFGAEPDGLMWIAMELVRGTPLNAWLKGRGAIPLSRFVSLFDRLCDVVHALHQQGITHRDLKPANVMVLSRGGKLLPKLLDLGIAKFRQESRTASEFVAPSGASSPDATPTTGELSKFDAARDEPTPNLNTPTPVLAEVGELVTGGSLWLSQQLSQSMLAEVTVAKELLGTPPYMAPEQWTRPNDTDARSDIYALGVLAYESLMGKLPFPSKVLRKLAQDHANEPPPPLDDSFPAALSAVIQRAMAKRQEDRFPDALALAEAFRASVALEDDPGALPLLDPQVSELYLQEAPQPFAETVGALEAARHPRAALQAVKGVMRVSLRYLGLIAVACRSGQDGALPPKALAWLQQLKASHLSEEGWFALLQSLCEPFAAAPETFPVPELVGLCFEPGRSTPKELPELETLFGLEGDAGAEGVSKEHLRAGVEALGTWLRRLMFVRDYTLVLARGGVYERWMGLRRALRPVVHTVESKPPAGQVALVTSEGAHVVTLSPLVQAIAPTPGAVEETFFLEGAGRYGAKLTALPLGFERHDDELWAWFARAIADLGGSGVREEDATSAPYLGLSSFTTDQAQNFFGRERETEAFANRLRAQPLLAVVGPSGAGKSSFIQAGVIPLLPSTWKVVTVRPGPGPVAALSDRLASLGVSPRGLREALTTDPEALGLRLRQFALERKCTLVLVVDQFEELITLCPDVAERTVYAEGLSRAARSAEDGVRVVLTLRDDFLMRVQALPALHERLPQGLQLLSTPGDEDLLRILTEPARRARYRFEDPALPEEMVRAVHQQPGALALLSFTASKLWELRDRSRQLLTRKAYAGLGGVGGALAHHAEGTLASLSEPAQALVREAFRHLVTAEGTRAVLARRQMLEVLGSTPLAEETLESLISARLVTASEGAEGADRVEVVHEALLASWPRLVKWQRDDAENVRMRDQLRVAARQWEERRRSPALLWREEALTEYRVWRARYPGRLTRGEEEFAAASNAVERASKRRRVAFVAAAFALLLVGMAVLARAQARASRSAQESHERYVQVLQDQGRRFFIANDPLRALAYFAAVLHEKTDAPALRLMTALAERSLSSQVTSFNAFESEPTVLEVLPGGRILTASRLGSVRVSEVDGSKGQDLARHPAKVLLVHPPTRPGDPGFSLSIDGTLRSWQLDGSGGRAINVGPVVVADIDASGRLLATSGVDGILHLWSLPDGVSLASWKAQKSIFRKLAFPAGGDGIVSAGAEGEVKLWSLKAHALLGTIHHANDILAVALSRDGRTGVSASVDETVSVWSVPGMKQKVLLKETGPVAAVALSEDARWLITGGWEGGSSLWDLTSGKRTATFRGHSGPVLAVGFSPDQKRLFSSGQDGVVDVWDRGTGALVSRLLGHTSGVPLARFDEAGRLLITGGEDGRIKSWEAGPSRFARAFVHGGDVWVTQAEFSPDGSQLVTLGRDRNVKLWSSGGELLRTVVTPLHDTPAALVWPRRELVVPVARTLEVFSLQSSALVRKLEGHASAITATASSRDGSVVASADDQGVILLWRTSDGQKVGTLKAQGVVTSLALDGQASVVATGSMDGPIRLWSAASGELQRTLRGHGQEVTSLQFSRDDQRLLSSSLDRKAILWDVGRGEQLRVFEDGNTTLILSASFSPDESMVVTGSVESAAKLWEAATGKLLGTLPAKRPMVYCARFSPEGDRLIVCEEEGRATVWDVSLPKTAAGVLESEVLSRTPFRVRNESLLAPAAPSAAP